MARQESELKPPLEEVQLVLEETSNWIQGWHTQLADKYQFRELIESGVGTRKNMVLVGNAESRSDASYLMKVKRTLSNFGLVDVIECDRQIENPDQPLMARFFYKPDSEALSAVSMGWRLRESDVIYEMIAIEDERIVKFATSTKPGVLFSSEQTQDEFIQRMMTQYFEAQFSYEGNKLFGWRAEVGLERDPVTLVVFENGKSNEAISRMREYRSLDGKSYRLPTVFNPTPYLKSFARRDRK